MHTHRFSPRTQRGFTIAELMIAIAIGLLILAGMTTLFVNNNKAQGEIEKANRQVENGRYAVSLLAGDLRNAGYYGEFDPSVLADPATLPDACAVTIDALKSGLPLHVQGNDNTTALSCLSDVRSGTDVLVVRHARTCVAGAANCDPTSAGGPFFQASLCSNPSELDSGSVTDQYALDTDITLMTRHKRDCTQDPGTGTLAAIRKYETHIYFVANNDKPGDGIPTLKRAELGTDGGGAVAMTVVPMVEGIDNLQLEYGLDSVGTGDGVADVYTANPATANGCAAADCAAHNWRNVVAVKLNVLARNTEASVGYTDTKSFVLGNDASGNPNNVAAAGDHFKRHAFQAMVNLPNPSGRKLP